MTPAQYTLYTINVALCLIPTIVGLIGLFFACMEIWANKKYFKKQ